MYSDILAQIRSTSDRELLMGEVEELKIAIFETKKNLDIVLRDEVRASISGLIREGIAKSGSAEEYLYGLEKEIKNLDEVKIVMAIEPTENLLSVIFENIAGRLNRPVILDLQVDAGIIGGAVISYKGKYYDGSLNKTISGMFTPQK